jgi:hypothetical protein
MINKIKFNIFFNISFSAFSFSKFSANALQLGEVADLEAQMFNLAQMFIRNPNVQFSTEPAILPKPY